MEHAILLAAVGGVLALDYAMLGQFMLSQPLVVGGVFGALLGDMTTGLFVGAMIQLIWLGMVPVGAYIPSDHTITGGIAVALTEFIFHLPGGQLGPSLILALMIAIPGGALAGQVDIAIRHYCNDPLARQAEAAADRGEMPHLGWIHLAALVPSYAKGFLIYWLWLGPGAWLAGKIMSALPEPVIAGLNVAYWALPALSFAAIFELSTRDRFHWWTVSAFAATWAVLLLWPQGVWIWMALAIVVGILMAGRKDSQ